MSEPDHGAPRGMPAELERALAAEVSLRSRMRYVAVGLAGGCAAVLIAVLWATEPRALPVRTQAVFAGLIAVGLAWAAVAAWALTRRRPLYAQDQVVGARLALVVSAVTGIVGTVLAAARGTTTAVLTTAAVGTVLTAIAGLLLARARSRRRELLRLRDVLRGGGA
ncbi:transmembrane transport protein [Actinacidiphila glaucinigra]|uniref:transmembrane transport protein n=1 Tax=Actinacidiphila glaucinigra TaxID=235986 RepID=UPI00366F53AB